MERRIIGLRFSGGDLNGAKSNYYVLSWKFHLNGIPYLDLTVNEDNPVTLNHSAQQVIVTQIPPDKHHKDFKSLGVRTPATLSDHYKMKAILKKGKIFSKFLM